MLDPGHGPDPGPSSAGGLATLVEQIRLAGQPVEFSETGRPPPAGSDSAVTAYRVVQEALTNALKHARGSRTRVRVTHGVTGTVVEVGTAASGSRGPGPGGRGLAGLRDRIAVLGGEFSAGRGPDGDFVVLARIPAGGAA